MTVSHLFDADPEMTETNTAIIFHLYTQCSKLGKTVKIQELSARIKSSLPTHKTQFFYFVSQKGHTSINPAEPAIRKDYSKISIFAYFYPSMPPLMISCSKSNLAYYGLGNAMFQKWNVVHIQVHWVILLNLSVILV